jgi:eukaryotic-like serine/threonine-protein kinase
LTCEHGDQLVGTVNYMAPEQSLAVHEVSEQADIYSLGATLYFLLCGCPPFPQGTLAERLWMHRFEQPAEIHSFRPDAPEELVDLCERMMAKDPAERIASMGEVAVLLRSWLVGV